jgi:hypothetical protein
VSPAPPQRAFGDFDGDGRIDSAQIQEQDGTPRIAIQLANSISAVQLDELVTSVVQTDIDRDGDLDLIAATGHGEMLVWLNDGHGRFTRKPRGGDRGVSTGPLAVQAAWPEPLAVTLRSPVIPASPGGDGAIIVTQIRPPTIIVPPDVRSSVLPALRAPPLAAV